jgi:hypothetical protein
LHDTPEDNGLSERANCTIQEKVIAMMQEAGLSLKYWVEAVNTAAYLKNLPLTKAAKGHSC